MNVKHCVSVGDRDWYHEIFLCACLSFYFMSNWNCYVFIIWHNVVKIVRCCGSSARLEALVHFHPTASVLAWGGVVTVSVMCDPCRHMKIHDKDPNTVLNSNPPSPTKRRRLCAKRKPSVEDDGDIADQSPNKKVLQDPLQVILSIKYFSSFVSLVLKWREQTVEVGSILLEYTKIY